MRTRNMGYDDYGMSNAEAKELKKYFRSGGFSDHIYLMRAAILANSTICNDLYYGLVTGLSYDEISKIRYIPLPKDDYYAWQRKCVYIFKNMKGGNMFQIDMRKRRYRYVPSEQISLAETMNE